MESPQKPLQPSYLGVFLTFARNSLIRDMTFRANFFIDTVSSMSWMIMNLGFYVLVYQFTPSIAGWGKYEFFVFIATTMFVNSLVQAFFMPNAEELSELVRTAGSILPCSSRSTPSFWFRCGGSTGRRWGISSWRCCCLVYAVPRIEGLATARLWQIVLYPLYMLLGVLILVQRDDRAWRRRASGWDGISRSTISGSTSPIFRDIRWRSTTEPGAPRCGSSSLL